MTGERARRAAAWAVHAYTAAGAVLAFAALRALAAGDDRGALLWLLVAVVVDATDGTLARAARVRERVPEIDGSRLDDLIDYLTFVFVPLAFLAKTGLLAGGVGVAASAAALVCSALRFCHADAKTPDHFFTGFPSYWNVLAFYLYVFRPPPVWNAALVLGLAALVLAPLRFVYPSRMRELRRTTVGLGCLWAAAVLAVVLRLPERSTALAAASLLYPAYYAGVSLYLGRRRPS